MIYFDTSYIARLYLEDDGWEKVRVLAATDHLACCLHGRAEVVAAFHRKLREGELTIAQFRQLLDQFQSDCDDGAYQWLPLSEAVIARMTQTYQNLPKTSSLRAADAIHLACAAENDFREIYSNDQRLLSSAAHFGISGRNLI